MAKYLLYSLFLTCHAIFSANDCGAQGVTIKGIVKGRELVLPFASVTLGHETLLTNNEGEFSFSVNAGTYALIITHAGYKKIQTQLIVNNGDTQRLEFNLTPAEWLDEVVTLGSRSLVQRSNMNTPVPVDVLSSRLLRQSGQPALTQMLNFTAPSINASRELLNEPIALRALFPDQTLILLNGSRYHNMALVNAGGIRGQVGKGSVSNDLSSIPFSAIENVEILRDGASAQYGSDAIAGVINIKLKKLIGQTFVHLHTGQYYQGDGENITLGIYRGIALNKRGFLTLSADTRFRNYTHRGGIFQGTVYQVIPRNAPLADSVRIRAQDDSIVRAREFNRGNVSNAGNSKLKCVTFLIHGGYPLSLNKEVFWTASMSHRKSYFIGTYLLPKLENQVNERLFPDGMKTAPEQTSADITAITGVKGESKRKWYWEYRASYGRNKGDYVTKNTNNPSQYYTLGKNAPSTFYTGSVSYGQLINAVNFTKDLFNERWKKRFNLGYGFEWRMENFRINAGEEASWKNYDSTGTKVGGVQNAVIFHPDDEVSKARNILAGYLDLEREFNHHFLLTLAGRYEYYSDFGGNLAGKLSARYRFSEKFSLRLSASNGFRAPALQQRFYSTTTYGITNVNGRIVGSSTRTFPNNSDVAETIGVPSLQPERSVNLAGGLMATILNGINLTVDAYWIQIKNRIVQSGAFDRNTNREIESILSLLGVETNRVVIFSNAINTVTNGIDIVVNRSWKIKKARLAVIFAGNLARNNIFGDILVAGNLTPNPQNTNTLFNRYERVRIEKGQPADKIILSFEYTTGRLVFLVRNTHFGKTCIANIDNPNNASLDEFFSSKIITDFSSSFTVNKWLSITAGVNNAFNVYPDRIKNYANTGEGMLIYGQEGTPFGINGGYYFISMSFNF